MTKTKKKSEKLCFWTDGDSFGRLLQTFWKEGQYKKVYQILEDGGLNLIQIKAFFEQRANFEGDTRNNGDLNYKVQEEKPSDFKEKLYWSFVNCHSTNAKMIESGYETEDKEWYEFKYKDSLINFFDKDYWKDCEDLKILQKFFSWEEIRDICKDKILERKGYKINPNPIYKEIDGVITRDGDFITCGYQEHQYLMPTLRQLGLVESGDWLKDNTSFHVSSGQLSGTLAYALQHPDYSERELPSQEQLNTLVKYKDNIKEFYGEYKRTMYSLLQFNNWLENYGGKFNNLNFLQKYYPELRLPKFGKSKLEGVEKQCIRTSPKYSLPGLLHSKFNLNKNSIKEIKADFEKFKNVRKDNELHYFYQEFIEGINGVCHYWEKGEFEYAVSSEQGAIVSGKKGNKSLEHNEYTELRKIASDLFKDLNKPLQLEFVINNGVIYIVQLRILENNHETTVIAQVPKNSIYQGITFSKGEVECELKDVLIVKEDAKSEELLGKKALIVTSNIEFSHILALSKALRIPSIYATGDVNLPDKIKIKAYNKEGFICKI